MRDCPRCETRMTYNDETAKLTEYTCPRCHNTRIDWKSTRRVTT